MKLFTLILAVLLLASTAFSADASSLKPPPGAKVAVVVFEDLACPDCARAYPVVWEVANAHHIPVVLRDFPLSIHPWSFDAAVYARYFDTKSIKLGNDFRDYMYKNQRQIVPENLHQYIQRFADQNKVSLPFAIDPQGTLREKVQTDYQLGQRIGVQHTPTIFVIGSNGSPSTPFVEVVNREKLTEIIEDMQRKSEATPERKTSAKVHKK